MGRVGDHESDSKSQLVTEICNISSRAITCPHRNPNTSPFIDWYLLLQVEENVGMDVIRKQYHKLALQLHPDKNKHPRAETAFKLLSEAHVCLSDDARRASFDLERWNSFCIECNQIPQRSCNSPSKSTGKLKGIFSAERLRSNKILGRMKDIRARFMEEARVIEDCLNASKIKNPKFGASGKEIPVFNPSDYLSHGYPHHWTRNYKKPERLWCLRTANAYEQQGKGKCDSPIFECSSERGQFRFNSVSLRS